jgi:Holliday junction resolvasome RuvABC endonuclease subunit
MVSIGIDQSYRATGFVALDSKGSHLHSKLITTDDPTKDFIKKIRVADKIALDIYNEVRYFMPQVVVIEGLSFGSVSSSTRDLAGLQALIIQKLQTGGYTVELVAPTSLKKYATGVGRFKGKEPMFEALPEEIQAIYQQYPKTKGRFDLTDAYWLAHWGLNRTKGAIK